MDFGLRKDVFLLVNIRRVWLIATYALSLLVLVTSFEFCKQILVKVFKCSQYYFVTTFRDFVQDFSKLKHLHFLQLKTGILTVFLLMGASLVPY